MDDENPEPTNPFPWLPPDTTRAAARPNAANCVCVYCKNAGPCTGYVNHEGRYYHPECLTKHKAVR